MPPSVVPRAGFGPVIDRRRYEKLFKNISKVAKNEKDVCALIDAGFEYVYDFDEHKIFRKRKY